MENSIINKISSIIISEKLKTEDKISLLDYIELMDYINNQISNKIKAFIKKTNSKLSNSLAFFDYEIKNLEIDKDIIISINHELTSKKIVVSVKKMEVLSDLKNKEQFMEIIGEELKNLILALKQYNYLNNILIKFKEEDLNVIIDSNFVELFMHKSPNWITMGKAFSLKYNIHDKEFKYEHDPIKLEKSIKNQEKLLFSKVFFDKKLLPEELLKIKEKCEEAEEEKEKGLLARIWNKLIHMVKK